MTAYFTETQRRLVVSVCYDHVNRFIARRHLTSYEHQAEQDRIRADFRANWKSALAAMKRDAKPKRRA